MPNDIKKSGRIQKAPENFIDAQLRDAITTHGLNQQRRGFLRKSFLAAGAIVASGTSLAQTAASGFQGDPNILTPTEAATTLGKPVAANPYGQPSKYETNLLRRESPGLTRVSAASVAFAPLQGLFGIITPNGLHFERHHQGWYDIDPSKHRFMINGLVKNPKVYTMDDLMRMPSVSRMHFIECGANSATEWGNVAVPTVQYTHGMLSCCEFTGVPLSVLLEDCGFDRKNGKYVLAEGGDGSAMTRTIAMDRALDDVIVAYGMNGEMLRPENGYPLRLVVPGVQGVSWVKWLRRIKV
ncbi:MAG: molybdopterin-dependent oxidoreductase, partial [Herbaspirillum sp.]